MSSKRLQVSSAVKALVAAALPLATVIGLEPDEAKPERIPLHGLVIVRSGDPGPAEIDLSPPAYNYDHEFPIELAGSDRVALDTMMVAIGVAIAADRTLGDRCTWVDADAPTDGETQIVGSAAIAWADLRIVASYTTFSPLG